MGFARDLFIEDIDPAFICSICLDVLRDAVWTTPCQHVFCSECLAMWMSKSSTCPEDRTHISPSAVMHTPRFFNNIMGKLRLHCQHGCGEVITYENIIQHVSKCPAAPSTCPRCGLILPRTDLRLHLEQHSELPLPPPLPPWTVFAPGYIPPPPLLPPPGVDGHAWQNHLGVRASVSGFPPPPPPPPLPPVFVFASPSIVARHAPRNAVA